ncbi:MAG TPA: peptidylprolyl isomerase [Pirellulales bacterium]
MRPGERCWGLLVLLAVWAIAAHGQPAAGQDRTAAPPPPDAVAATVDGQAIKVGQVLEFVHHVLAENQVTAQTTAFIEAQALAQLVDRKLVGRYLDREKISASAAEMAAAMKKVEDQAAGKPGGLKAALAVRGISLEEFRTQLAWDVRWAKYLTQTVTNADLRAYFDAHRAEFDGTEVRVSHILVRPDASRSRAAVAALESKALMIRQEISSGRMSFAEAAQRYSDGPSRRQGGDLGFIPRRNRMVESFSAAAFKLKKGELSQPVVTPYGLHLIECTEIKPGDETWEQVRDTLAPAFAKTTFQRLAGEMRSSVAVDYTGVIPYLDPRTGHIVAGKSK